MRANNVHLEDVTRAARQGVALSLAVSLLCLAALLTAGVAPALVLPGAAVLMVLGTLSGGFGLVVRVALRPPRPSRRAVAVGRRTVTPIRVAQPR